MVGAGGSQGLEGEGWPSFAMLGAVAFLVWCSKTALVSPRAGELFLREREERKQQHSSSMAEPSWAMWSPGRSCYDCSSHWSCCWNHQALQSHSCKVRPRRLLWPASETCQVPQGFALSLFFHCFWSEWGKFSCKPFQRSAFVFPYIPCCPVPG